MTTWKTTKGGSPKSSKKTNIFPSSNNNINNEIIFLSLVRSLLNIIFFVQIEKCN